MLPLLLTVPMNLCSVLCAFPFSCVDLFRSCAVRATLCVAELEDSYRFRKICLESQLAECSVVAVSLEHQMDLTSERESKNLNLVATIFLPLTFWAGVFGMNFQVDGG